MIPYNTRLRTFFWREKGEFPFLPASVMTIAMLCSAQLWLELIWGVTFSYQFTVITGAIFSFLMSFVFTMKWWSDFSRQGPWNLLPSIVLIIPVGAVVSLSILPYLTAGVLFSFIFYDLRFIMVRYEAILYCFMIGAPVNRIGCIRDKRRRIVFPKHWSFIDIIMFAAMYSGRRWCALSKLKMLIFIPFTPFLLLQGIMLKRDKKKKATRESLMVTMQKMIDWLEEKDEDLLLYAEGTRSRELKPFQSIMAHVAIETETLLTPLVIKPVKPYMGPFLFYTQPPVDAIFCEDIDPMQFADTKTLTNHAYNALKSEWEKK